MPAGSSPAVRGQPCCTPRLVCARAGVLPGGWAGQHGRGQRSIPQFQEPREAAAAERRGTQQLALAAEELSDSRSSPRTSQVQTLRLDMLA